MRILLSILILFIHSTGFGQNSVRVFGLDTIESADQWAAILDTIQLEDWSRRLYAPDELEHLLGPNCQQIVMHRKDTLSTYSDNCGSGNSIFSMQQFFDTKGRLRMRVRTTCIMTEHVQVDQFDEKRRPISQHYFTSTIRSHDDVGLGFIDIRRSYYPPAILPGRTYNGWTLGITTLKEISKDLGKPDSVTGKRISDITAAQLPMYQRGYVYFDLGLTFYTHYRPNNPSERVTVIEFNENFRGKGLRSLKVGDHVDRIKVAYGEPKPALRFLNDYQPGVEVLTAQGLIFLIREERIVAIRKTGNLILSE